MVADVDASASPYTPANQIPPELDILIDFVAADDRPTLILNYATTDIVYANNAFDAFVATASRTSTPATWCSSLLDAARSAERLNPRTTHDLGFFANQLWSARGIASSWIAITCDLQTHAHRPPEDAPTTSSDKKALAQSLLADTIPLQRQESDNLSTTSSSTCTSSLEAADLDAPLEDLIIDWLLFPKPSADPWLDLILNYNWQDTSLGPIKSWPTILRQMFATILASREPRVLHWGNEMHMLYNEQARFVVGELHPWPLGRPMIDIWGDAVRTELIKMIKTGIKKGKPLVQKNYELNLTRNGFSESCFFDLVFLPVPSPDGRYLGVLAEFTEITEKVLQKNRQDVSKSLLQSFSKVTDLHNLWQVFVNSLQSNARDVSYAVVYTSTESLGEQRADTFQLEASCNIDNPQKHLSSGIFEALKGSVGEVFVLQRSKNTLPQDLTVSQSEAGSVNTAYILPIMALDGLRILGVAVLGLNPRRAISPSVRQFVESIRDMLFKTAALFSLPTEQLESREIAKALSQQLETMTMKAEETEQNFTRMLRDAPIGMCMHRDDGRCVYVNDVCLDLLGMSRAQFYKAAEVGLAWRDAVHDEDFEAVNQTWTSAIEKGTAASAEFRVKATCSQASEVRWLEISAQQRHDKDGNLEYLYVWLRDISTSKQLAEQRLQDALETKRRSEVFIDMVSHEMRNPLGAILLLADSIVTSLPAVSNDAQASVLTPDLRQTLSDIAASIHLCANHQKVIVEEILTFSRLDSNLLVLAPEKIRPSETVQTVLKMVKAELDYDNIQGSLQIQQSYVDLAIDNVALDPGRLSQIILNLMTNAIKFTKNSSERRIVISLAASRTRPTADDCQVTLVAPREDKRPKLARRMSITNDPVGENVYLIFSVRDTGCGLTPTEMGHLFHRFSQASPKTYKQYGGSGLGLFISRELVELQGGQIGVRSEPGEGSTFAFFVETARIESPPEPPSAQLAQTSIKDHMRVVDGPAAQKTQVPDLHVLLVEDNAINQKILAQQLRKTGCARVHVADHGLDALELLSTTTFHKSTGIEQIPLSIILLDVEMPIMDGLTCARRIREYEKAGEIVRHVPIIGITANARSEQIASCIDAGMDEVVTKPFRVKDLLPRMLALVDQHNSAV
ncbi:histidine kinase, partial [Aureobasidium melanogenum]|uniref:histidine kinase n=1 Tax=Aureobasidium melanogenum (strain CBS 110374) TaxID=1043003 RepID=A0A074W2T0_AURM1